MWVSFCASALARVRPARARSQPTAEAAAHPAGTRVQLAIRTDPVLIARDEVAATRA